MTAHIFESPLTWDHLARPFKLKLLTAQAMPTLRRLPHLDGEDQPGIYFSDDPAFRAGRELVAADYVYAFKRIVDPSNKSRQCRHPRDQFLGLAQLRDDAQNNKPFDYDGPSRAYRLTHAASRAPGAAAGIPKPLPPRTCSAASRGVVEFYGDQIDAHRSAPARSS
jgi:hypothetical protein